MKHLFNISGANASEFIKTIEYIFLQQYMHSDIFLAPTYIEKHQSLESMIEWRHNTNNTKLMQSTS